MSERKEISLQELDDIAHGKSKTNITMDMIQVEGIAVIKDKDGNIKGRMNIVSLDSQELEENAIS